MKENNRKGKRSVQTNSCRDRSLSPLSSQPPKTSKYQHSKSWPGALSKITGELGKAGKGTPFNDARGKANIESVSRRRRYFHTLLRSLKGMLSTNCCRKLSCPVQFCLLVVPGTSSSNSNPTPHSHSITQHPPLSPFSNVSRAALVAASKTSSTPSPVRDEHSRYFRAPISCAISDASRLPTKCWDFFRISSIATGSSLKSFFKPTSMIGTPGHLSFASSTHYPNVSHCQTQSTSGTHFMLDVVQGVWSIDRKSNEDNVCF